MCWSCLPAHFQSGCGNSFPSLQGLGQHGPITGTLREQPNSSRGNTRNPERSCIHPVSPASFFTIFATLLLLQQIIDWRSAWGFSEINTWGHASLKQIEEMQLNVKFVMLSRVSGIHWSASVCLLLEQSVQVYNCEQYSLCFRHTQWENLSSSNCIINRPTKGTVMLRTRILLLNILDVNTETYANFQLLS